MFGIDSSELLLIAVVALVVIGPKDLPKALRVAGYWVGKARGIARQFRTGFDSMVREAELEEMEKRWAAENERIMREHPSPDAPVMTEGTSPTTSSVDRGEEIGAAAAPQTSVDEPMMVERPVVAPAPEDRPTPKADGALS